MFIKPQDIPADAEALVWTETYDNTTDYTFKKTLRAAKMLYNKIPAQSGEKNYREYGWSIITDTDRKIGKFVG